MSNNEETPKTPDENAVQKTIDYTKFKLIDSNRTTSRPHVQALVLSMTEHPELIPTRPILVNENMEVIDGQHRLQALMRLNEPVYYQIAKNTDIEAAQIINSTQKAWRVLDFARSFALTPIRDDDPNKANKLMRAKRYKIFLALFEEYGVAPSILTNYCALKLDNSGTGNSFRIGNLAIADEERSRALLDQLMDIRTVVDKGVYKSGPFQRAVFQTMMLPGYDHDRMLKKLQEKRLDLQPNRVEYIRALERVYNYNYQIGTPSYLRFF